MIYRILYENINKEKFEIVADDNLFQVFPKYFLQFCNTNLNTGQWFYYKIGVTLEVLYFWGVQISFGQSSPEEQKIKIFLIREGFKRIQDVLDEKILENQEFIFDRQNCPERIEDTQKQCCYLRITEDVLKCKISNDFTTYSRCGSCGFPEYFAQCKHVKNVRARKIEADTEYWFEISADCNKTGEELKNSEFKNCIDKSCFEPVIVKSPREKFQTEEDRIIREIREKIDSINLLMKSKHGFELFKIQQQKVWNILTESCVTEEKFTSHILSIKNIIDWMNIDKLRMKITGGKPEDGSINCLDKFLQDQKYPVFNLKSIIKSFRTINNISQCFPRHKDTPKIINEIKSLGIEYPIKEWQKLWDKIVLNFLVSLTELEQLIS
jgi:hypothetical protein